MTDKKDKLNDIYKRAGKKNILDNTQDAGNSLVSGENNNSSNNKSIISNFNELQKTAEMNKAPKGQLNFRGKWQEANMISEKTIAAQELVLDTKIKDMEIQAGSYLKQSHDYWQTKASLVSESIRNAAQNNLDELQNIRAENKMDSIIEAYYSADKKIKELFEDNNPEELEKIIINEIFEIRNENIKNIKNNTLAKKYNLSSDE